MSYEIEVRSGAMKDLRSLDRVVAERILKKLDWIKENFDFIVPEPLSGEFKGLFKLRVGSYRVLYTYDRRQELITVHLIGHRREIYR